MSAKISGRCECGELFHIELIGEGSYSCPKCGLVINREFSTECDDYILTFEQKND